MARRSPSPAEIQLAETVSARLVREVTPQRIERARQTGYLRPLDAVGRSSSFDERLVREIAAFMARSDGRTPLYEVALAVFVHGEEIGEDAIRRAYSAYLDATERFLRGGSTGDSVVAGRAAAPVMVRRFLRTKDGRRWKRRLVGAGYDADATLEQMVAELFAVILGGPPPSEDVIRAFLDASGLAAAELERVGKLAPWAADLPVSEIAETLPSFSIPALRNLLDETTYRDLCRCRTATGKIVALLNAVAPVITKIVPTRDALGFAELTHLDLEDQLPLMILVVRIFEERGYGVKRIVRLAERFVPLYRAVNVLLDAMPRRFRRFMAPDGIGQLNTRRYPERLDFVRSLKSAVGQHPAEAEIAGAGTESRPHKAGSASPTSW
jgi:hypothetical protein